MNIQTEKLPKSAMKLTITVENSKVKEFYDREVRKAVENTEIEGFRKGTAPRDMVVNKIGESNLYAETINEVIKTYYPQALKENKIMPVSNPKVEIKEFDIKKDLEFTAEFALRPEVKVGNYKKSLKNYLAQKKEHLEKEKLEKLKKGELKPEEESHDHAHIGPGEVIDVLLRESQIEIADILIQEETDRTMSQLMQQLKSINLPLEKYLKAQEKNEEDLRNDYNLASEKSIKAEFVLSHLIQEEKIEVTEKEIDDMINAVGDPTIKERMEDPMQRLYIKTILQKNKLINLLIEETQGPHTHDDNHDTESHKKD